MSFRWLAMLLVLTESTARADMCDSYRKYFPKLFEISCKGGGKGTPKPNAGGGSSFGSSFNLNPAAAPNQPSPYGLETVGSILRMDDSPQNFDFSFIKGFNRIGAGASTTSNNTFFGNDIVQRRNGTPFYTSYKPDEKILGKYPNFSIGTSIGIIPSRSSRNISLSLGVSGRYNKTTDTLGYGTGLVLNLGRWHFGTGIIREQVSNLLPEVDFYSGVIGAKLKFLELEYTFLQNSGGYSLEPVHIGTATIALGRVLLTGAVRRLVFSHHGVITQSHLAMQYQLNRHLSAGWLFNYIPGANSAALQIFM